MCQRILHINALTRVCSFIQVVTSDLDRQLDELSESLGARPLDVPDSQVRLNAHTCHCIDTLHVQ